MMAFFPALLTRCVRVSCLWGLGWYPFYLVRVDFYCRASEVGNGYDEGMGAVGVKGYMTCEAGKGASYYPHQVSLMVGGGDEAYRLVGVAEHEL